ncbi:MAG: PAS domain S-box protein [Caldilineaceae bacterium]
MTERKKNESQRQRLQDEIHQQNQFLHMLIESSPLGIVSSDKAGAVTLWNPSMGELLGWRSEEVIGQRVPLMRQEDRAEFAEVARRIDRGETIEGWTSMRKDGGIIDLSMSAGPLYDRAGQFVGVIAMLKDITERKRMENATRDRGVSASLPRISAMSST